MNWSVRFPHYAERMSAIAEAIRFTIMEWELFPEREPFLMPVEWYGLDGETIQANFND